MLLNMLSILFVPLCSQCPESGVTQSRSHLHAKPNLAGSYCPPHLCLVLSLSDSTSQHSLRADHGTVRCPANYNCL